jgi:membrane-associated phospholipid phosphatase
LPKDLCMRLLIDSIKVRSYFYSVFIAYIIVFAFFLLTHSKSESFYILFGKHNYLLNAFFQVYTFLGDGIFAIALCLIVYWRKQKQLALAILICFLISGTAAQLLKNFLFSPRPKLYFDAANELFAYAGLTDVRGGNSSFPSGHTTTTFSIVFVLAMYIRNQYVHLLLFGAAMLVGYSRIYLGQHFPEDVFAGSIIGLFCGVISYLIVNSRKFSEKDSQKSNKRKLRWI